MKFCLLFSRTTNELSVEILHRWASLIEKIEMGRKWDILLTRMVSTSAARRFVSLYRKNDRGSDRFLKEFLSTFR